VIALERTAERCNHFDHIQYGHLDLAKDELPGKFDLICCSEVLYFVGGINELKAIANKISKALLPNGYLVMAHAHQLIDEPDKPGFDWGLAFGAKVINDVFSAVAKLQLKKEIHTPLYRVQLFQKSGSKIFSWFRNTKPFITYLEQPTAVPDAVKDSVRWNGGEPSGTGIMVNASTNKLPILMYHRVAPEGADNMNRYRITPAAFEEQLKYLKDSGYYSAGLNDWLTAMAMQRPLPGLAIAFTFDDAYQDFYEYAWPLLKQYDFTAIVFLVSDHIGKHNSWDEAYEENLPLMGWKEILELEQQGVEFGSHSATHKPLTSLSPAGIVSEGAMSRIELQKRLQKPVKLFAYPYGDTDGVITHLIGGCGYTVGFSCDNKLSTFTDDTMRLPRIEVEGSFSLKDFIAKLS
jgi:peptidoglycan/xylan/chitin deacetylase (PgdA/CDA1 family)